MRGSECESELEITALLSRNGMRQFIGGSDERPVSIAKISPVKSSKHSSSAMKPDFAPNTPNHGVHTCAGTSAQSGEAASAIFKSSFESMPMLGRRCEFKFSTHPLWVFIFFVAS